MKELSQGDILVPGRDACSGVVREGQRQWTGGSRGLDRKDLQGKKSPSGRCPLSWDPEEADVMELVSRRNKENRARVRSGAREGSWKGVFSRRMVKTYYM